MAAVIPKALWEILCLCAAPFNDPPCRPGQRLIGLLRAMLPAAVKARAAAAYPFRRTVIDALRLTCRGVFGASGHAAAQKLQHLRGIFQARTRSVRCFLTQLIPSEPPCEHPQCSACTDHHTAPRARLAEHHKRQIWERSKASRAKRPMLRTRKMAAEHGGQQQRHRPVGLRAKQIQRDSQHCRRKQLLPCAAQSNRAKQSEIRLRHQWRSSRCQRRR